MPITTSSEAARCAATCSSSTAPTATNAWQLREWLVGRNTDTSPTFTVETIKDNPQEQFYTDIGDPLTDFADLQRRFQQEFVSLNLVNLMQPEIDAKINGTTRSTQPR